MKRFVDVGSLLLVTPFATSELSMLVTGVFGTSALA